MRKLTVVGRDKMAVFDDMEPERKMTVHDKGPVRRPASEWQVREGRHPHPEGRERGAAAARVPHFLVARRGRGRPARAARDGVAVVRTLEQLQASLDTSPA